MSTYSVQFGTMQEAAQGLQAVYQRLTQIGEDLQQQVQAGTIEFEGNTKNDFMMAQQKYEQAHGQLSQSLSAATDLLNNIDESYSTAENRGARLWSH
jgi:uncharacterized protein YukE